jgi:hypothetical protein
LLTATVEAVGDRRHEIAIIGIDAMEEASIRHRLDRCLVGDHDHFTLEAWICLPSPFHRGQGKRHEWVNAQTKRNSVPVGRYTGVSIA